MESKQEKEKLDLLISEALKETSTPTVPDNFADRLARKFELHTKRNHLITDWLIKLAIILGIGIIFSGIYYLTNKEVFELLTTHLRIFMLITTMLLFVFFFDQVILKWMFFIKKQKHK